MSIIYIIFIYAIICFCMILFNILAIFYGRGSSRLNKYKIIQMKKRIRGQFERIRQGLVVEEGHLNYLRRKLKKGNNLMMFDQIVTSYQKRENLEIESYLKGCSIVFVWLMYYYAKKSGMEKAYYFGVVRDYGFLYQNNKLEIDSILFESLQDKSFYCRDNAYLAICKMGNANKMIRALLEISNSSKFFHRTLLINGLSIYAGNQLELLSLLMKKFDYFSNDVKCCIIEFASYYTDEYSEFIKELLISDTTSKDIRISCLNYFEYIFYLPVEEVLLNFANDYLKKDFWLCYGAIKALRNYNTRNSIRAIKKAIYFDNFRIRNVACESLAVIRLGLNSIDLEEVGDKDEVGDMYNYYIRKNMEKMVK